jgi:glycosyltransferase involved in cell wall biosynthesis
VLFYGQLIPLHGIETILKAALSERGRAHGWHIIGKGQQSKLVTSRLAGANANHIVHEDWVPYNSLISAIAETDICLGIFGSSRKAASVVPNKVYQCLAAGRTVITRQSPAMDEVFPAKTAGLMLVPDADPAALLDAIDAARIGQFPVIPEDTIGTVQPREIGRMLCDRVLVPLTAKT